MKRRRVKITGIGPVTPAGIGREEFWKGILEPVSRVRPFGKLGDEYGPLVAAYLPSFDIRRYAPDFEFPKGTARHTLFAAAGMRLALSDAKIDATELRRRHCAIVVGSSLLDFGGIGSAIDAVSKRGPRFAQPRVVYTTTQTSVSEVLSQMSGAASRSPSVQTACCAGLDAIGRASEMVANGEADMAICGGTEAPLHRFPILELRAAGLTPTTSEMSGRLARPFDRWRTTGVVSEGACIFVLEPADSPRPAYSYIDGYGYANDGEGGLCSGLLVSGRLALAGANLRPADVDLINAWGPGHREIDRAEAKVLQELFGSRLAHIPALSIKGAIGAPLGAAPAIQVAVAALAQLTGLIPPTVNWEYPDPECPLNLCARARALAHDTTLVNAHGVGSVNSALILRRC